MCGDEGLKRSASDSHPVERNDRWRWGGLSRPMYEHPPYLLRTYYTPSPETTNQASSHPYPTLENDDTCSSQSITRACRPCLSLDIAHLSVWLCSLRRRITPIFCIVGLGLGCFDSCVCGHDGSLALVFNLLYGGRILSCKPVWSGLLLQHNGMKCGVNNGRSSTHNTRIIAISKGHSRIILV